MFGHCWKHDAELDGVCSDAAELCVLSYGRARCCVLGKPYEVPQNLFPSFIRHCRNSWCGKSIALSFITDVNPPSSRAHLLKLDLHTSKETFTRTPKLFCGRLNGALSVTHAHNHVAVCRLCPNVSVRMVEAYASFLGTVPQGRFCQLTTNLHLHIQRYLA